MSYLNKKKKKVSGFTLVELLVSMSIFVIITSISLANYSEFGGSAELKNAAYEVSMSLVKARIYGIGSGGRNDIYEKSYGIHLDKDSQNSYILFVDKNDDEKYSGTEESVEIFSINKKFKISKVCGILPAGSEECFPSLDYIDIIFKRPMPEIVIGSNSSKSYQNVEIYLNYNEKSEIIAVNLAGRIMVK